MSLPHPNGPLPVGSITLELQDPGRPRHLMSAAQSRKLLLKLWYPARPAPGATTERLWKQLRDDGRTSLIARTLLTLIRRRTASHPAAAFATAVQPSCPVIYNHGLISFASENTSMMEDLASRGHVVIAIEHRDQLSELRALNRHQALPRKRLARDLTAKIRRASTAERAGLARRLYEASDNTNRIALERAKDTSLVLDNWASILAAIPGRTACAGEPLKAHLVGYSLGGAVATEVARRDERVAGVVNIDGGLYGSIDAGSVRAPYLMIYSARNDAINDELLPKHAARMTAAGTYHLNYHDVAGLLPPLRWARAIGSADPVAVLEWRNRTVAEFVAFRHRPMRSEARP